jgi:hypothetical protein
MAITTTVVKFMNVDGTVTLTGDQSVDVLRERFKGAFGYVTNATADVAVDGSVKTVTFIENTGDKGSK